jgi:hypothetical protein
MYFCFLSFLKIKCEIIHSILWFIDTKDIKNIFWVVLEYELRTSYLLGRCSITCATYPALFAVLNFQIGSCIFAWGCLVCDPTYTPV